MAAKIRLQLKLPRFEQSDWHEPAYWANRFGYRPKDWAEIPEIERAEMIATAQIEDAMELVSNHSEKITPEFSPMKIDKTEEDNFWKE